MRIEEENRRQEEEKARKSELSRKSAAYRKSQEDVSFYELEQVEAEALRFIDNVVDRRRATSVPDRHSTMKDCGRPLPGGRNFSDTVDAARRTTMASSAGQRHVASR